MWTALTVGGLYPTNHFHALRKGHYLPDVINRWFFNSDPHVLSDRRKYLIDGCFHEINGVRHLTLNYYPLFESLEQLNRTLGMAPVHQRVVVPFHQGGDCTLRRRLHSPLNNCRRRLMLLGKILGHDSGFVAPSAYTVLMTQGMNQMWLERGLPFLEAVAEAEERAENCSLDYVATYTGLDPLKVQSVARNLKEEQLIDGAGREMLGTGLTMSNIRLTASGRKALRQWPSDV